MAYRSGFQKELQTAIATMAQFNSGQFCILAPKQYAGTILFLKRNSFVPYPPVG